MPRIALVMIARDEARCIARCLRSVRPWVDEMIVLDTGSKDNTVALAQAEGAQVHHFTWVNDFAAARNAALALSKADWNLVLDADEWLTDGGPALAELKHKPPQFVGSIEVNSHFGAGKQAGSAPTWLPRVLPKGVRYTGRIHEHPHNGPPTCRLGVHAEHDGYMDGPMQAKGDRNLVLLQAAVSENPNDPYLHYQLGKDHEVHDRYEQACAAYARAYALCPADTTYRHDLVIRYLFALKQATQLATAIELAEKEMPNWEHSPDFFFTLGDVLLSQATENPSEANALLPMIESCWLRCLELGESPELEGAVRGRGTHLAAHNLVVFYESLGEMDKALPYRRHYFADTPSRHSKVSQVAKA
jgi:glycosyltransferase involved in cell wall biosynthesis